ncbi:sensor histidine kinase [Tengunoibacter tsumagoiensis]|uniref:Histidine kinase domain-containing protein n=1 Tax=Tengunoibacter tsumagoiensis TaxID=2014871 RepID=A0A401ZZT5_9CHLR|nr:sensor histidine kinase [Tengunoibacter tsumagoiensis]GCE12353.1 hypothetical protein KTT_22120 [Tengunoibacter tsumagoiensis]
MHADHPHQPSLLPELMTFFDHLYERYCHGSGLKAQISPIEAQAMTQREVQARLHQAQPEPLAQEPWAQMLYQTMAELVRQNEKLQQENTLLHLEREKAHSASMQSEYQHLLRELHDAIIPAFYCIELDAQSALAFCNNDASYEVQPLLQGIVEQANTGLTEARALILDQHPAILEREGLLVAISRLARFQALRSRIAFTLDLEQEPEIPLHQKCALYRITSEAIHNALKHAQATSISVSVELIAGHGTLTIQDDGKGFDGEQIASHSFGLRSMRARAEACGAQISIQSMPGQGCMITVIFPI